VQVFDLTDGRTLEALERWLDEIREHLPEGGGSLGRDVEVILVGNKADKVEDREVTPDAAKAWGKAHGVTTYVETSAKTNTNVQEAFEAAVAKVLANPILREKTSVAYKNDMRAPRPGIASMPAMQPVVASKGCCS
jgi:GTPase SAR1 family protein